MSEGGRTIKAAHEILLAAADLDTLGKAEFSEWDLTVAAWKRDPNRFGCRGYETIYPDHKRVMMEIMGAKADNPMRKGWLARSRPNHYRITPLGRNEAQKIEDHASGAPKAERSGQDIYDAVLPYFDSPTFKKFARDPSEPKMWLGAASFLRLTRNDASHMKDRLSQLRGALEQADQWLSETRQDAIRRGPTGGGVSITRADIDKLKDLASVIRTRFEVQIEAVLGTGRAGS